MINNDLFQLSITDELFISTKLFYLFIYTNCSLAVDCSLVQFF